MKKYILLIFLFSFSISFAQDYHAEWREVMKYELDGKVKSASEVVDKIYKKAKRKNVEDQIIKCFFYKSKFLKVRDENAQSIIIKNIIEEIAISKDSKKALLNYIYVNILENYYERNRYVINKRTNLAVTDSRDFLTWTQNDFEKEISKVYSLLLKDEIQLHEVSIKEYSSIFEISPYTDAKKWSVYDFLQDKTLKYYFYDLEDFNEKNSTKIISILLSDSKEFEKLNADTISNIELKNIVEIFQKNEKYVLKNSPKEIHSLQYDRMNRFSKFIEDKEFYFSQLAILQKETTDLYLLQDIKVDFANHYYNSTTKISEKNYYTAVLSLIESVLNQKENPSAKANMEILKEKILKKRISIYLEDAFYLNQNYRAFVTFKNVDTIKVNYYKIPVSMYSELQLRRPYYENNNAKSINHDSLVLNYIENNKAVKSTVKVLPNKTDYFEYTTEILMDNLDMGHYLIFFETKNPYYTSQPAYAFKSIQISNINFVQQENNDFDTFNLLDRKTGKPIENATIKNDTSSVRSDKTGKANFKLTEKNSNSYSDLFFIKERDTLYTTYVKSTTRESQDDENFDAKSMVFFRQSHLSTGTKSVF
ncbi:hypothetical protein FLAN108750_02485 [Flavobacterium antarcticum]|uniref:hypothetical protein n=1 Tax=Flavobacterium antarcticum TaxID=271155 RepID=UPI0003B7B138|nr:hypothetical protein [Flavobacterium antarcticum]